MIDYAANLDALNDIDLDNPVNRDCRLNDSLAEWWKVLPDRDGGTRWWGLAKNTPATLTNMSNSSIVLNGEFEGGFTSGKANFWTGGTGTFSDETTIVHTGAHSQKVVSNSFNGLNQALSLTNGASYQVDGWIYVASGRVDIAIQQISSPFTSYASAQVSTTGSWQNVRFIVPAATFGATTGLRIYDDGVASTYYIDDFSVQIISNSGWGGSPAPGGYGSLRFDGGTGTSYVLVPPIGSTSFTVLAWVLQTAQTTGNTYKSVYSSSSKGLWMHGGKVDWFESTDHQGGTTIPLNAWTRVGFTHDFVSNTLIPYVNGKSDGGTTFAATMPTGTVGIGGYNTATETFAGSIDGIKIYSRALSSAEVAWEYQDERAGCPESLNRITSFIGGIPPVNTSITPDTGTVTVLGVAPGASVNTILAPGTGSLGITGPNSSSVIGTVRVPASGSIVVTGVLPSEIVDTILKPGTGGLTAGGVVSNLTQGFTIAPGTGTVVTVGQLGVIGTIFTIVPSTGTVGVVGNSASYIIKTNRVPITGSLDLIGQLGARGHLDTIVPGTGRLRFTGRLPILTVPRIIVVRYVTSEDPNLVIKTGIR